MAEGSGAKGKDVNMEECEKAKPEGSKGIRLVTKSDGTKILYEHYEAELVIHEYPAQRRWNVCRRETLQAIKEVTKVDSITTVGNYLAPWEDVSGPKKRLHMLVKGPTEESVQNAKAQLKRVLEEEDVEV